MKQYLKLAAATALVVAGTTMAHAQAKKPAAAAAAKPAAKPAAHASAGGTLLGGHPNLNGIWQVINEANYNLEPHDSSTSKAGERQLGAIAANHGGLGVVEGGVIPYKPEALKIRDSYRATAPKYDPHASPSPRFDN
ncbi:MAG: hypothetical protein J7498_15140, partial [Sphingobium sp.]|nr:hypothetical protein [Sphingobium sp.]